MAFSKTFWLFSSHNVHIIKLNLAVEKLNWGFAQNKKMSKILVNWQMSKSQSLQFDEKNSGKFLFMFDVVIWRKNKQRRTVTCQFNVKISKNCQLSKSSAPRTRSESDKWKKNKNSCFLKKQQKCVQKWTHCREICEWKWTFDVLK